MVLIDKGRGKFVNFRKPYVRAFAYQETKDQGYMRDQAFQLLSRDRRKLQFLPCLLDRV